MNAKQMSNASFIPEIISIIEEGHTVTLPLKGNSMRPFLQNGRDKAILKKPDLDHLKVGDVVLAELHKGHFVLHRIIDISNGGITLLGDGNLTKEYCKKEDLKAIAVSFFRKDRTKADSVDDRKWKLYSYIWMQLYPIRRYILFILKHFGI